MGSHPTAPGGIRGLTVRADDPMAAAERWAEVLGAARSDDMVRVDEDQQVIRFQPASDRSEEGIAEVKLALPPDVRAGRDVVTVAGVRFALIDEETT